MKRAEFFEIMGNNARLQKKSSIEAERLISALGENFEDFNNFWYAYHKGKNREIIPLPTFFDKPQSS